MKADDYPPQKNYLQQLLHNTARKNRALVFAILQNTYCSGIDGLYIY
jgi:hypothetical protein